jgi:membrane-bound lytic murein transglycosylase A
MNGKSWLCWYLLAGMKAASAAFLLAGSVALAKAASLEKIDFSSMAGWEKADHRSAFQTFLKSCPSFSNMPRPAGALWKDDKQQRRIVCQRARQLTAPDQKAARRFFEANFTPAQVIHPEKPFLTAYFEPVLEGSRKRTLRHTAALRPLPPDVVALPPAKAIGSLRGLTAARRLPDGRLVPYPNRSDIEKVTLEKDSSSLVWLDPVDAFFTHIQGSARIRLNDGSYIRAAFAGRNGHSYTPIGKVLVERGALRLEEVTMQSIRKWLQTHPSEAQDVMNANASYIFFRIDKTLENSEGPRGAAGVPLTNGHSLAIDPRFWPYGVPIWISGMLPLGNRGEALFFSRLMVAQDTGAAIRGPRRADIFLGSGDEAGQAAGRVRHEGNFIVLVPRGTLR